MSPPGNYPCTLSPPSCALSPPSMHTLAAAMRSNPHGAYAINSQQFYGRPYGEASAYGVQMAVSPPARPAAHRISGLGECAQCQMYGLGEMNDADGKLYCTRCWKDWDQVHASAYLHSLPGSPPLDGAQGYHYAQPAYYAPLAQQFAPQQQMSPPPHHQHHQQHKHQRQQSHSQLHQHYYALPPGAPPTRLGVSMGAPTSEDGSPSHHQSSSYDQRVAGAKHQSPACPTRLSVSLSEGSQSPEDILQPLARGGHQSPTGRGRRRTRSRENSDASNAGESASWMDPPGVGELQLSFNDLFIQ